MLKKANNPTTGQSSRGNGPSSPDDPLPTSTRGTISFSTTGKKTEESTLGRRYCRPHMHCARLDAALNSARQHSQTAHRMPGVPETQRRSLGPVRAGALASPNGEFPAACRRLVSGSTKWATGGKTRRPTYNGLGRPMNSGQWPVGIGQ
jgi:hypothetical protein